MDTRLSVLQCSITCLLLTFGLAAEAEAVPLKPLLHQLQEKHPRLQAERENVVAATAAKQEAMAGFYPVIDLQGSAGRESTDRQRLFPTGGKFDLNPNTASATLTQNVFEGFRTIGAVETAEAGIAVADTTREGVRQQLFMEGITAYLTVLRQVELTRLAQRNMRTLQEQLNLEDERVQRGSGIAVDVLQAKSRLQISKERFTAFSGGLQDAITRFTQVFGKAPNPENLILPSLPDELIPAKLEEAVQLAIAQNPVLSSSEKNAEAASHRRTTAAAGYYPAVDLVATSNYQDDVAGIVGEETNNALLVRGRWQIFSGFADVAREKQAVHGYQAALALAQDTRRRVEEEVKLAWNNLKISAERAELLENATNIASEVYDARTRLRDAGSDTALNVLDAENEYFRAQIDATAARYDYYLSVYRLLMAMGVLTLENI